MLLRLRFTRYIERALGVATGLLHTECVARCVTVRDQYTLRCPGYDATPLELHSGEF